MSYRANTSSSRSDCSLVPTDEANIELAEKGKIGEGKLEHPITADDEKALSIFYDRYQYVMVFPMVGEDQTDFNEKHLDKSEQSLVARNVINGLLEANFEVHTFLSIQKDELFVLLRMDEERLLVFADKIGYLLPLNPEYCKSQLGKGLPEHRIKPVKIADESRFSYMHPFDYIFGAYQTRVDTKDQSGKGRNIYLRDGQYTRDGSCTRLLSDLSRLKLIYLMLLGSKRLGGCKLDLETMLLKRDILALYPAHNSVQRDKITRETWEWCKMPWSMNFEDLRNYFGEKWSLFYVFLGHQSKWLVIPSILGFMAQTTVWSTGPNYSHPILPFFSIITCCWAILWINFWKREEVTRSLTWGMTGFEDAELSRPQFRGELITSPVDGSFMLSYPERARNIKKIISNTIIFIMMLLVVGAVSGIYIMRYILQNQTSVGANAATVASLVNAVQIAIFNIIYATIAQRLNDAENHETDTSYQDALTSKVFIFQFVNSYISFFYVAFIAQHLVREPGDNIHYLGQCGFYHCMAPLANNLAVLYGSRLTSDNIIAVVMDWYSYGAKRRSELAGHPKNCILCSPENEYCLLECNSTADSITLYADTAIQFGFCVLFVAAQPICFGATLLSNYIRVKLTTWKMLSWYQRPVPLGIEDIGTWQSIFHFIAMIGVITNGALICFTMDVLKSDHETNDANMSDASRPYAFQRAEYSSLTRAWLFFGFCFFMIGVQVTVTSLVPEVPSAVSLQLLRSKFICSKIIDHIEDDDYDDDNEDHQLEEAVEEAKAATASRSQSSCFSCFATKNASDQKRKFVAKLDPFPVIGVPRDEEEALLATNGVLTFQNFQQNMRKRKDSV